MAEGRKRKRAERMEGRKGKRVEGGLKKKQVFYYKY